MTGRITPLLLVIAVVVAACSSNSGSDEPRTVAETTTTDATTVVGVDGVAASIADTSRIVSLNGDLTEVVFALGAGDRVVGIDLTTTYPAAAAELPDIGLARDLNAEAVIGLAPTLVIGDTQVQPESAIEQIRDAGIPVLILQTEVTLEGVPRKIARLGEVLGLPGQAAELATSVQSDIDSALALLDRATTEPRVAYIYVRGPETLLLFGNGMPTHFLIEAAGGIDAAADVGVLFAQDLSAETLVEAAPEVLITPTQGFEILGGIEAFLALPGVADTPAGETGTVITYDEARFLGMGPRVGQALRQLILDLHPEIEG